MGKRRNLRENHRGEIIFSMTADVDIDVTYTDHSNKTIIIRAQNINNANAAGSQLSADTYEL